MEGATEPSCPICYELLKGKTFYGCFSCANAFHVECLNKSVVAGNAPVCPVCRSDWQEDRRHRAYGPVSGARSGGGDGGDVRVFLEEERSYVAPRNVDPERELGEDLYNTLRFIPGMLSLTAFIMHNIATSTGPPGFPIRPCALEKAALCNPQGIVAEFHGFNGKLNLLSSIVCMCLNMLYYPALQRVASCPHRIPYIALAALQGTYALSAVVGVEPIRHVISIACVLLYLGVYLTCVGSGVKLARDAVLFTGYMLSAATLGLALLDVRMLAAGACALVGTALEGLNQKRTAAYGRRTHVALFLFVWVASFVAHNAVASLHATYPVPVPHIEGVLNSTILY